MSGAQNTLWSVTRIKDVSVGNKTALYPANVTSPNCAAFNTICKDTSMKNVSKNVTCIFTDGMHSSYYDTQNPLCKVIWLEDISKNNRI